MVHTRNNIGLYWCHAFTRNENVTSHGVMDDMGNLIAVDVRTTVCSMSSWDYIS